MGLSLSAQWHVGSGTLPATVLRGLSPATSNEPHTSILDIRAMCTQPDGMGLNATPLYAHSHFFGPSEILRKIIVIEES